MIFTIVFSLILTLFCYLFIPIIVILIGKPLSLLKLRVISACSFVIGFLLMAYLKFYIDGVAPSGGGALLWTFIGYRFMKNRLYTPPEKEMVIPEPQPRYKTFDKHFLGLVIALAVIFVLYYPIAYLISLFLR